MLTKTAACGDSLRAAGSVRIRAPPNHTEICQKAGLIPAFFFSCVEGVSQIAEQLLIVNDAAKILLLAVKPPHM
jgi:hypothetical protein